MKILVTGGAGFIGSHLVDRLVQMGHDVTVLDVIEKQVHTHGRPEYLNRKAKYIIGDIRDRRKLSESIKGTEVISHQAAAVGVGQSMYQIEKYVDVNSLGTAALLDFLVNGKHDVRKFIVASSMSIYGEGSYICEGCGMVYPDIRDKSQMERHEWEMRCNKCGRKASPLPTDEEKPLKPTSVYATTKRSQEELCLNVGRSYGIPTVSLRYFNVYGPRQSLSNPYTGVCAIFSSRIKNGKPPLIFEDGLQSRDFVNVRDIVQANILAMEKKKADYNYYNVGTGVQKTILDVANTLIKLYGMGVKPRVSSRFRAGDIRHCFSDIRKISDDLGYRPSVTFEDGMKELVEWGNTVNAVDRTEMAERELKDKGLI